MYVGEGHKYGVEWPDKGLQPHCQGFSMHLHPERGLYLGPGSIAVGPVTSLGEQRAKSEVGEYLFCFPESGGQSSGVATLIKQA
jgi:hypothetical protein